jgi:hypothetical protein
VNVERAAGVVLIVAPLWFNATFALLGKRFDYPDILRRPTAEILDVTNTGDEDHDLVFEGSRLHTRMLSHGQSEHLDLGEVTGDLQFECTVPFHASLGMKLHIQVA